MIIIRHTKKGSLCFVSHVDTMRVILRSLMRTGVEIKYSEGFNPHPLVNLSHPLPLGVASECEYIFVNNTTMDKDELFESFKKCSPDGIQALYALVVNKNPNAAGKVAFADYFIKGDFDGIKDELRGIIDSREYPITFTRKNAEVTEDIRPLIKNLEIIKGGMSACLATGNPTLRPDKLCEHFNAKFGTKIGVNDITRTCQYVLENESLIDMDTYIKENYAAAYTSIDAK